MVDGNLALHKVYVPRARGSAGRCPKSLNMYCRGARLILLRPCNRDPVTKSDPHTPR